jgi:hypothetical protein
MARPVRNPAGREAAPTLIARRIPSFPATDITGRRAPSITVESTKS